ncbi:MAG TPA: methyltransferase domain-containing protein [Candidatus Eisenbacteria bacterium]|nr:methyltransferase domain-containing protein [Candidatus Eisenbacteria bacterium]
MESADLGDAGAPVSRRSSYIHGTDPEEQRRLSLLNDRLNAASLREIGIAPGERILDLGSGLGQLTRAMAVASGETGKALGIDFSPEQVEEAKRLARAANEEDFVEFRVGDAVSPPLREEEWGTFDVAHARFLLEHVPDPGAVVRSMVRAVRPAGRIVLEDEDHDILRLWPEPREVEAMWRAYIQTYVRLGNDPHVGRKLVSLLHGAGASPRRNNWIFFGGCSGSPHFPGLVENMIRIMEGAREEILATRLLDERAFEGAVEALRAWSERPDAGFWYGMGVAEGVRSQRGKHDGKQAE